MKKIVLTFTGITLLLFSGSFFNNNKSLKELNAKAIKEAEAQMANSCCPIWDVTVTYGFNGTSISCSTGGEYQCKDCTCPNQHDQVR